LLPVRDVITWNVLIAGYAQSGESENAFDIFEKMRASAEQPDMVTFLCLLNACSQVGMVHKGQVCYEVMSKDYGITPTLKHYTCMVNLVCRAGHLARAMGMLSQMVSHPDHVIWHCILDASTKWGNMTLSKEAYERVMELEDKDPSPYVSICSVLADPSLML
jgi:pentatricopeptide repeat protein